MEKTLGVNAQKPVSPRIQGSTLEVFKIGKKKPLTALEFFVPLIKITSSSAMRSSITSSACPRSDKSNVSSPSMSANVVTFKEPKSGLFNTTLSFLQIQVIDEHVMILYKNKQYIKHAGPCACLSEIPEILLSILLFKHRHKTQTH